MNYMDEQPNTMNTGEILLYQNQHGSIKIDVRLEEETVWLTQAQIALLFGKRRSTITEHIANVFKEGELDEKVVCRDFRHTTIIFYFSIVSFSIFLNPSTTFVACAAVKSFIDCTL